MYLQKIIEESKVWNVKELAAEAKKNNEKLLSTYSADFWLPYQANHSHYDRLFRNKYLSFFPYAQDEGDTLASVLDDFQYDVYALLQAHNKDFSELFRLVNVDDEKYSLYNNYDMVEKQSSEHEEGKTINKGAAEDSTTYGEFVETETGSNTTGAQTNTTTNSDSAFNASTFTPTDQSEESLGEREDEVDLTNTHNEHVDTYNYGAREDGETGSGSSSYTLTRVGNIGVMTVSDMFKRHIEVWSEFNFYNYVFDVIASELLRGV